MADSDNSGLIIDALLKTNPGLAAEINSTAYKADLAQQGARVDLFRDYERGDHRAVVTDQMRNMLRLPADNTGIADLNNNYMRLIIDKMAGRIRVNNISIGHGRWVGFLDRILAEVSKVSSTIAVTLRGLLTQLADKLDSSVLDEWVSQLQYRNDFDALQGILFRGAIRDGESFVMIDPITGKWSAEPAYDGFSGMVGIFDTNDKTPVWACKLWGESATPGQDDAAGATTLMKLIVYQLNQISYWQGEQGTLQVRPDNKVEISAEGNVPTATNVQAWPVSIMSTPIVHFVNQYDTFSTSGESELRPAIPLQDMLNRTMHSMIMASEFSAFQIKWSIGMEIDANGITPGAVVNLVLKDGQGNIATELSDSTVEFLKAVRVGQFDATDISQYINQIDRLVREISQNTQTPIYGVTAQGNISGEALKQLEIGLIGKVERFQNQNSDAIRELIQLTSRIYNAFRGTDVPSAPVFETVNITWKSAELLDATAQIDSLIKMRKDAVGLWSENFYRTKIGNLLGMSQQDIDKQSNEAQQEQQNNIDSLVGADGTTIPVA